MSHPSAQRPPAEQKHPGGPAGVPRLTDTPGGQKLGEQFIEHALLRPGDLLAVASGRDPAQRTMLGGGPDQVVPAGLRAGLLVVDDYFANHRGQPLTRYPGDNPTPPLGPSPGGVIMLPAVAAYEHRRLPEAQPDNGHTMTRYHPYQVMSGAGASPAASDDEVLPAPWNPHPPVADIRSVPRQPHAEPLRHPGGGQELKAAPSLPIPVLTDVSQGADVSRDAQTRYVVTSVDRDGRLADRSVTTFMGWSGGQTVEWAVEPTLVVIARTGAGARVNRRGHLRLPLTVRRACAIAAGDRVLVAGDQRQGELLVIPSAVLTSIIDAYRRSSDRGIER
jgi:bifunctional DNA-binding transcriptional regulator/antitoxin component of YhaV-PrlF toxin-antitoxin module